MRQGGLANSSGNTLETTIVGTLTSKGFGLVNYREWQRHPERFGQELLLRNVPYTTIYDHPGNTEFLIKSAKYQIEVRIECKWQQSSGSVDEKFPYLYLNCIERMPEKQIIVIVDGGGAKAGAITWLKRVSQIRQYIQPEAVDKQITIMNLSEFLIWVNRTFR